MTREKFENMCYSAYQLDWMIRQGYSLSDLFDIVVGLAAENVEEDPMNSGTDGNSVRALAECARERFLTESGFGSSSLYVCKDEFLGAEYLDENYMWHLFSMMPFREKMMALWETYRENDMADQVFISEAVADRENADFINAFLELEPENEEMSLHEDETITATAVFENGFKADVKCCGVQYREGESNLAWTEAVLFNERSGEVSCTEPGDSFFGRWELYNGDDLYIVNAVVDGEDPEINEMMTISTAHISSGTEEMLDESDTWQCGLSAYKKDQYGWFIHVPSKNDMDPGFFEHIPDDLAACMKLAQDHRCAWLCFDCDGPQVKGLQIYEE